MIEAAIQCFLPRELAFCCFSFCDQTGGMEEIRIFLRGRGLCCSCACVDETTGGREECVRRRGEGVLSLCMAVFV